METRCSYFTERSIHQLLIVAVLIWLTWFLVTLLLVMIAGAFIGDVIGLAASIAMKVYYKIFGGYK